MANLRETTTFFSVHGYDVTTIIIIICMALALYNALELVLLIFTTFHAYRGLYFWSLLISSFGVIPYTIGFLIEYFQLTNQIAGLVVTTPGWVFLITGQSVVLYSRLGIVLGKGGHRILQWVKWMIIVDGIIFHVSTTVVVFGAYLAPDWTHFADAYKYIEKIQMTGFTIQEFIISGLYVWKTLDILKTAEGKRANRVMWQLFSVNVLIIAMDIALLVIEYKDEHVLEQAFKSVFYSVKLKLEFAILSKLVGLTKLNNGNMAAALRDMDDYLDDDKTIIEVTRTESAITRHQMSRGYCNAFPEKDGVHAVEVDQQSGELSDGTVYRNFSTSTNYDIERRPAQRNSDDLYAEAMRSMSR